MATPEEPRQEQPNLPVVPVTNLSDNALWLLYERYGIPFTPPTLTEYKLCTVIAALEQLVEDLGRGTRRPE
ncbi:hypothetical protein [Hymenobacter psychrotolerans]|uniref:Uncharacterized protein n=1 Tax=Hymenobacter psychrotolerans DSM 18569 TaxID=1121959 RepID=A0A1M6Z6K2_9BACT|nr:hypothetical protein [Hymenobacter psychrotolerans]SHL26081.1 hypothetical protein SAMN02746009_02438 [Hymenobacter psychrotolerans DSM 18569]